MAIIKCEICGKQHSDRAEICPFCQTLKAKQAETDNSGGTKSCPYCAEIIKMEAVRCRFCGMDLVASAGPKGKTGAIDVLLLACPWIGIGLVLLWVENSPLIVAGKNMGFVTALVILGSALLIALDAGQKGIGSRPDPKTGKKEGGPITWLLGTLLLWVVIYPLYMFRRGRYGIKSNGAACLIGALLFAGISIYYTSAISAEHGRIRAQLEQNQRDYERSMREVERLLR